MPVSEISGVTIGPSATSNPLMDFAEHLQRARENERQQAQQQFNMMVKMTTDSGGRITWDPKEVDKVAKRAGFGGAMLSQGPAGQPSQVQSAFAGLAEAARTREKQQTDLSAAQLDEAKAGTESTRVATALRQQQLDLAREHQKQEADVNLSLKRLREDDYTGTPDARKSQRMGDALNVGIFHKLDAATMERLGLTSAEALQAKKDADEAHRLTLQSTRTKYALDLSNMVIVDPQTKKPRNPNQAEIDAAMAGQRVPGLTTLPEFNEMTLKAAQAAADTLRAQAEWKRAEATGKLTDIEVQEHDAKKELLLAQAKALKDKGMTYEYKDLLDMMETLRNEKLAGRKPDEDLMRRIEVEMAKAFGGTPKDNKDWLGRLEERGFNFPSVGPRSELVTNLQPRQPTPEEMGGAVLPAVGRMGKGAGEFLESGQETAERFVYGLLHPGQPPLTPEQLKAMRQGPKYPPPFGP